MASRRSFHLAIPENSADQPESGISNKKVAVLYYLSRDGKLEHPHFIEVPLSSAHGLFLSDVLLRLNLLRGEGMANLYSWSSKRSYRNGFVWQDLCEHDLIHPSQGHDYILKGSELLLYTYPSFKSSAASSPGNPPPLQSTADVSNFSVINNRKSRSDSGEYKVYKATYTASDLAGNSAADASTQTGEPVVEDDRKLYGATELSRDEISPPSSSSSTETLEMMSRRTSDVDASYRTVGIDQHGSGRVKISTALIQLVTCGSTAVKDAESAYGKDGESEVKEQAGRLSRDARYQV